MPRFSSIILVSAVYLSFPIYPTRLTATPKLWCTLQNCGCTAAKVEIEIEIEIRNLPGIITLS